MKIFKKLIPVIFCLSLTLNAQTYFKLESGPKWDTHRYNDPAGEIRTSPIMRFWSTQHNLKIGYFLNENRAIEFMGGWGTVFEAINFTDNNSLHSFSSFSLARFSIGYLSKRELSNRWKMHNKIALGLGVTDGAYVNTFSLESIIPNTGEDFENVIPEERTLEYRSSSQRINAGVIMDLSSTLYYNLNKRIALGLNLERSIGFNKLNKINFQYTNWQDGTQVGSANSYGGNIRAQLSLKIQI